MPLYEYHCVACQLTFEELNSMRESNKKKACPSCGKRAPRIVSAFAISSGAVDVHAGQQPRPSPQNQHQRPLCMRYPQVPLSCHMDEYSVKRFAAHSVGRGSEFDDTTAKAAEVRKQRGLPEPSYAPPSHGHDHTHGHSHKKSADSKNFRRHAHSHDHTKGKGQSTAKAAHSHSP